jgi:hypothetical protein
MDITIEPTHIDYYADDTIWSERWMNDRDEYHNTCGPAIKWYYHGGILSTEEWMINDLHHRLDGPAIIFYNEDGTISREKWYINDCRVFVEKWLDENCIYEPFTDDDLMAIKLRWG